ncbi:MAG: hypothetical protein EOO74_12475 [Myxococcales bacterium]|nr:MAG: hypothetical protein EOO74_12475 [Myxococcales bacterium]
MHVCHVCGEETVMPVAAPGRRRPHRRGLTVVWPANLVVPTCQNCGEEYLDGQACEAIAAAAREQGLDQSESRGPLLAPTGTAGE